MKLTTNISSIMYICEGDDRYLFPLLSLRFYIIIGLQYQETHTSTFALCWYNETMWCHVTPLYSTLEQTRKFTSRELFVYPHLPYRQLSHLFIECIDYRWLAIRSPCNAVFNIYFIDKFGHDQLTSAAVAAASGLVSEQCLLVNSLAMHPTATPMHSS